MAVETTIFPQVFTFGANTWDSTTGGPIMFRYTHDSRVIADRTGDDYYATYVAAVDLGVSCSVTIRQLKQTIAQGTKDSIVMTIEDKSGGAQTITLADMVFIGQDGDQPRANPSEITLSFVHESSDGKTNPIS